MWSCYTSNHGMIMEAHFPNPTKNFLDKTCKEVRFLWWVSMDEESLTQSSARTVHHPPLSDWTSPCSCAFQGSCYECSFLCCHWEPSQSGKGERSHWVSGTGETEKEHFSQSFSKKQSSEWENIVSSEGSSYLILLSCRKHYWEDIIFHCFQTQTSPISA